MLHIGTFTHPHPLPITPLPRPATAPRRPVTKPFPLSGLSDADAALFAEFGTGPRVAPTVPCIHHAYAAQVGSSAAG